MASKAYREANRERLAEIQRAYYKRLKENRPHVFKTVSSRSRMVYPERYLLTNAKSRAKKKSLDFNLEVIDIVIPEFCPVLGIKLEYAPGLGKQPQSPSLDRIDNSLGYVRGNVQVISWRANDLKSNGSLEEFKKLVEFMENG